MNTVYDFAYGTWAVFLREMLLLKNKLKKFGFVVYSLVSPLIFLAAFGFGFGSRISFDGVRYEYFLVQGIVCMTSMMNSYNLVMTSVSFGRLYTKSFQNIITSPVSSLSIMTGLVMSGILRGVMASAVVMSAGFLLFDVFPFGFYSVVAIFFNLLFFSSLGVMIGLYLKDMESNAMIMNFFIMPMNFFSGTFYPVDNLPPLLNKLVYIFPLTHTNIIIRAVNIDSAVFISLITLIILTIAAFLCGVLMLKRYSE
ncbi:ABC transporter [Geovibrio thiophilus]|uniref:Transport permease protein n=1 Tax=Geovibrio thiophilus TaxID=139438 RepID=A0A410JZ63_9BACT|nr:ABC transporter permease [Geovibrio thiophilus]QAR33419.1 ABC transporter [Geovibrio thiophilus]